MLVSKTDRLEVYKYLVKEGVLVVKKDRCGVLKHKELGLNNLVVFKLMQSLESREYVKCTYNWQYNYFFLTNEGLDYLREYCHFPETVVPDTHKSTGGNAERRPFGESGDRRGGDRPGGRGRFGDKEGAGGDYKPSYRGGYGRGAGGAGGREGYRRDEGEKQTE